MWQTFTSAMRDSWQQLALQFARVLPNVLASLVIFAFGIAAGVIVGAIAKRALKTARIDRGAERLGIAHALARVGITSTALLIARALKWVTISIAFIPALYTLDPDVASDLLGRALGYLPQLAVAAALLWIGVVLSRFLARGVLIAAVNNDISSPRLLASGTRVLVLLATIAIVLEHVGIGRATVLTAFAILFGGLTLAAALAIGLGSQDLVREWLAKRRQTGSSTTEQTAFRHW
jgi:hypothetical protein